MHNHIHTYAHLHTHTHHIETHAHTHALDLVFCKNYESDPIIKAVTPVVNNDHECISFGFDVFDDYEIKSPCTTPTYNFGKANYVALLRYLLIIFAKVKMYADDLTIYAVVNNFQDKENLQLKLSVIGGF